MLVKSSQLTVSNDRSLPHLFLINICVVYDKEEHYYAFSKASPPKTQTLTTTQTLTHYSSQVYESLQMNS